METPPDTAIASHAQRNQVCQRARQQAEPADVYRPGQQHRWWNVIEQQNGRRDVADKLRQANRRQPQSACRELADAVKRMLESR